MSVGLLLAHFTLVKEGPEIGGFGSRVSLPPEGVKVYLRGVDSLPDVVLVKLVLLVVVLGLKDNPSRGALNELNDRSSHVYVIPPYLPLEVSLASTGEAEQHKDENDE